MINKNDKIRVLEVPSELGAGTRGASLGIGALKVAASTFPNINLPLSLMKTNCCLKIVQHNTLIILMGL